MDSSLINGQAGAGIRCGQFRAALRVPGMQKVYRAEVIAATLAAHMARPGDEICLDNMTAANNLPAPRTRPSPDQDFRDIALPLIRAKGLRVRWVRGHQKEKEANTPEELRDVVGNNISDELARYGGTLPRPPVHPCSGDILHEGQIMETPAKTWVHRVRRHKLAPLAHWLTWKPLKGRRRRAWLTWLWGQAVWAGCAAPWDRRDAPCQMCNASHPPSVQLRLSRCKGWSVFWDRWEAWWGPWASVAAAWRRTASQEELDMCVRLWIPKSFIDGIRRTDRPHIRVRVGHFQYQALMGVHRLRGELIQAAATPNSAEWLTPLHVVHVQPRPNRERLRTQVGAPWTVGKRRAPTAVKRTAPTAVDEWNGDLNGDLDAQAALTRILAERRATKRRSTDLHALNAEAMVTLAGTFAAAVDELKVMARAWTLLGRTQAFLDARAEMWTSARQGLRGEWIAASSTVEDQYTGVVERANTWLLRTNEIETRLRDLHLRSFHEYGWNHKVQRARELFDTAVAQLAVAYQSSAQAVEEQREERAKQAKEAWARREDEVRHRSKREGSPNTSPASPAKRRRVMEVAEDGDIVVLTGVMWATPMMADESDAIILTGGDKQTEPPAGRK